MITDQTIRREHGKLVLTRREHAESVRSTLISAGRRLFVARGYWSVSDTAVVEPVKLTRGALYYHFDGMEGLFEAIFNQLEDEATQRVGAALMSEIDPWQQVMAGIDAYLAHCCEPDYREIVMLQGQHVLGVRRWRELDRRHFQGLLEQVIRILQDAGHLRDHPADLVARAGRGSLIELGLAVADADDQVRALAQARRIARSMMEGLDRPSV